MIAHTFQDPFSPEWIKTHVPNSTHDLMILRHILPWQSIIDRLTAFYDAQQGRNGQSLRTMVKPRQYRSSRTQARATVGRSLAVSAFPRYVPV